MKLSRKCRYAIRALIDLAKNFSGKPVSIRNIDRRQNISSRYLENIFHNLTRSNILKSLKGKGGGFKLINGLCKISILDIIEALEGKIEIADCVSGKTNCAMDTNCYTKKLWINLNDSITSAFKNISLADVIKDL